MPTALELGHKGWKHYIEATRRRRTIPSPIKSSEQLDREQILARVREVSLVLKSRFKAQRVILFGSLAHDAWFMPDSDVDLAVEGLQGEAYWQTWSLAEELITDRPVDLIELESVSYSMRQAIKRYGMEI